MMNEVIYIKCLKNRKNPRILYKGIQILKLDILTLSIFKKIKSSIKKTF